MPDATTQPAKDKPDPESFLGLQVSEIRIQLLGKSGGQYRMGKWSFDMNVPDKRTVFRRYVDHGANPAKCIFPIAQARADMTAIQEMPKLELDKIQITLMTPEESKAERDADDDRQKARQRAEETRQAQRETRLETIAQAEDDLEQLAHGPLPAPAPKPAPKPARRSKALESLNV